MRQRSGAPVGDKAIELESKTKRLAALISALVDLSSAIPSEDPHLEQVQVLLAAAEEWSIEAASAAETVRELLS